ncbi:MAG: response regulator transcription factor [Candidatus Gastranaerophilales bacterium]|nr:response regulator transcription factor [Candidatus Gastranaerophilales bacterium]
MKIKVLLVEDHIMARMGTAIFIQNSEDLELVGQAEDGLSAVQMAQEVNADVILMDIGLPKIDGIEATKRIKEKGINSSILMLTSRDNEDDVYAALQSGADGYIMKGCNLDSLLSAIKSVSQKAAWLDPMIARLVLSGIQRQNLTPKEENINKYGLTKKELEVLSLISQGYSNKEISDKLVITISTAKAHVHNILSKLYVGDRVKATIKARNERLI